MNEILVRGGTLVTAEGRQRADLLCRDGLIAAIGTNLEIRPGTSVIDAGGCFGAIIGKAIYEGNITLKAIAQYVG